MFYTTIPLEVVRDPALSAQARALYGLLATYDGPDGCIPGQVRLRRELQGVTKRTLMRWTRDLERSGRVDVELRVERHGKAGLRYRLRSVAKGKGRQGAVRIPHDVLRDPTLSAQSKTLYMLLASYDGPAGCVPRHEVLQRDAGGCSQDTIGRWTRELESADLVTVDTRRDRRGMDCGLFYRLRYLATASQHDDTAIPTRPGSASVTPGDKDADPGARSTSRRGSNAISVSPGSASVTPGDKDADPGTRSTTRRDSNAIPVSPGSASVTPGDKDADPGTHNTTHRDSNEIPISPGSASVAPRGPHGWPLGVRMNDPRSIPPPEGSELPPLTPPPRRAGHGGTGRASREEEGRARRASTRAERAELEKCAAWVGKPCTRCAGVLLESDNRVFELRSGRRVYGIERDGPVAAWHRGCLPATTASPAPAAPPPSPPVVGAVVPTAAGHPSLSAEVDAPPPPTRPTPDPLAAALWAPAVDQLRGKLRRREMSSWIDPIVPVGVVEDGDTTTLLLAGLDPRFEEHVADHLGEEILAALPEHTADGRKLAWLWRKWRAP